MNRIVDLFLTLTLLLVATTATVASTSDRLVQLIDYVGVDYSEAVVHGKIVNEAEYAEMVEFASAIEGAASEFVNNPGTAKLHGQAGRLRQLIGEKAPAVEIMALTREMRATVINAFGLKVYPDRMPDLVRGAALYQETCAGCHGVQGQGDGPLSKGLDPAPTDFTDGTRFEHRSLYALFNTITFGVEGTGMGDFSVLSRADRWSLAAYVGQIAVGDKKARAGKQIWEQSREPEIDINSYATLSPVEAGEKWKNGYELQAYLRTEPAAIFEQKLQPIMLALKNIQASAQVYAQGNAPDAYQLALTAYLEGFELVEANLAAVDSNLMQQIEGEMLQYRSDLYDKKPTATVEARATVLVALLQRAQGRLNEEGGLTPEAAFIASLVILLREGLEALLVVAAISALLIKSDRRDAMKYLHFGWIAAILLGAVTWLVSDRLVQISGATREVTEGIAALAASGMLLFVGYWLHSKTSAAGWQVFIQKNLKSALSKRTLWGLTGLSFISVYREVFETILFYQALWAQAASAGAASWITSGFVSGLLILAVVAWGILKFGVRLPVGKFFGATGVLLVILSFVFAGKGIAALQEAGKIQGTLLDFSSVEWLGIYPTMEGLMLQATIILMAALVLVRGRTSTG